MALNRTGRYPTIARVCVVTAAFTIYLAAKLQAAMQDEFLLIVACQVPPVVVFVVMLIIIGCPSDTGLHVGLVSTARFFMVVSMTASGMAGFIRMQLPQTELELLVNNARRTAYMTPFILCVSVPIVAAFHHKVTEPLSMTARTASRVAASIALPTAFMGTLWMRTGDEFFLRRFVGAWLAMLAGFGAASLAARCRREDGSPLQDQLDLALQVAKGRSRNVTFFVLLVMAHALPLMLIAASLGFTRQAMALICIGATALVDATVQRGPWASPGARPWLGPRERHVAQ